MFSMYSRETNKYSLLKDGNFQLHLARANKNDIFIIPNNCYDFDEFLSTTMLDKRRFLELELPVSAVNIRETFWEQNEDFIFNLLDKHRITQIVCDMTGASQRILDKVEVCYNLNISYDPENPRPYIDKFLERDVEGINKSLETYVLNEAQVKPLVDAGADIRKIVVRKDVVNKRLLDSMACGDPIILRKNEVFFPFRLTDPCYKFEELVKNNPDTTFIVTDPNDTVKNFSYKNIRVRKLSKSEYYRTLKGQPRMFYYEDPSKVFHPGLAELIHFKCKIESPYINEINSLKDKIYV